MRSSLARALLGMGDGGGDAAVEQARRLQARGQRLQAELRRLQRKFLPAVLGRVKTPSDQAAEAAVSASLRTVVLECLDLVGSEGENWKLRVGAASVAPLAACRDWACLELYAIGSRLATALQDLSTASPTVGVEQAVDEQQALHSPVPETSRQCSIIVRGLDRCTEEAELQHYEAQLREVFNECGTVLAAKVRVRIKGDGVEKTSWGLVAFSTPEEAERAVAAAEDVGAIDCTGVSSGDWTVTLVDNRCVACASRDGSVCVCARARACPLYVLSRRNARCTRRQLRRSTGTMKGVHAEMTEAELQERFRLAVEDCCSVVSRLGVSPGLEDRVQAGNAGSVWPPFSFAADRPAALCAPSRLHLHC